jgi:4-diphosphocytidyl-2-C-methyl-D-erythritol kinase
MVSFPIAKINLGLHVVEKRADGFHNIETIFFPIGLSDILEVIPAADGSFGFRQTGIPSGRSEQNLCVKAYRLFREKTGIPPVHIHLHKLIPVGAGLGGGSSDAAYALKMLDKCFNVGVLPEELHAMAESLGSDCPYFLDPRPVYATGKGTRFSTVTLDLEGKHILLVKPKTSVNTGLAYSLIKPGKPQSDLRSSIQLPISQWESLIQNDFEEPVVRHIPILGSIRKKIKDLGARFVAMSGSGSCFYGIFDDEPERVASTFPYCFTWKGRL